MNTVNTQRRKLLAQSRTEPRYQIEAPVEFSWTNLGGVHVKTEGTTQNIGTKSASIQSVACPPIDTLVEVKMTLPFEMGNSRELHVTGQAKVIRVEKISRGRWFVHVVVCRTGSPCWEMRPNPLYFPQ
jgi:hypothetical protein